MNWPLKPRDPDSLPKFEGTFPGVGETVKAAVKDMFIGADSWRWEDGIKAEIVDDMRRAISGNTTARPKDETTKLRVDAMMGPPEAEWGPERTARNADLDELLGIVAERRQTDPGHFYPLPASQDEFQRELNRRRQIEKDDADTVLRYSSHSVARFGGEMVGALADPYSLPFLFMGGSGGVGLKGFAKFMAAEGIVNAVAEVPQAIKRQQVSDEMGWGPQDTAGKLTGAAEQIGFAGAAGAAFAGVLGGAGRALSYFMGRKQAENAAMAAEGAGLQGELAANAAEAAMRKGQEPPSAQVGGIDFGAYERKYGLPEGYLGRTAWIESKGNPAAQNPNSSAGGLFQFVDETAQQYGLTNRFDPAAATDAAARLARDNAATLRRVLGRDPTAAELYLAHQQGGAGAAKLLANPDARAVDIVGADAVRLNGGDEGMSAGEFANLWIARHEGASAAQVPYDPHAHYSGAARGSDTGGRRDFSTRVDEVVTPGGTRVPVRYRVVDASELKAAAGDLQPRDRSRAASDEQIAEMAARLDPARLMPSPEADRGTPIVGPDMVVESGNGRVAALNRAATENPQAYAAYVEAIKAHAEIPEGVTRPVLVAERTSDLTPEARRAFVREANTSSIARMAPSEQARLEGDFLTARSFDSYQPGRGLNAPENAGFVRGMLALMPQSERAALLTAEGRLNIDGIRRIRQALFARAFGADDILKMVAETENPSVESLLRMLEDIAGDWAAFRSMVDAGYVRPEFDITDALMDAVRLIAKARTENLDGQGVLAAIRDRLAQADLFGERDPLVEALIGAFFKGKRARPADAVGEILRRYAAEAAVVGRADMADIFDAPVTPAQALARAVEGFDGRSTFTPARGPADASGAPPVEPLGDISAFDAARFTDGAESPAVERVVAALDADMKSWLGTDARANAELQADIGKPISDATELDAAQDSWSMRRDTAVPIGPAGEGGTVPTITVGDLLDDLQADTDLIAAMTSCALKGVF